MTQHAELSRDLALAIGWLPEEILMSTSACLVAWKHWRKFDYRDPSVWGPVLIWLMQKYHVWPHIPAPRWTILNTMKTCTLGRGNTLPEAVARAAIAVEANRAEGAEMKSMSQIN